jgi:hypothetical protein
MSAAAGTVYLLHFSCPYRHARHYLGFSAGDVRIRVVLHQAGQGARLLAVVRAEGIGLELVRTWPGDRNLERRLKRRKNSPRMCPVCRSSLKASLREDVSHAVDVCPSVAAPGEPA